MFLTVVACIVLVLAEHIPVKQGLRLWDFVQKCYVTLLAEHIPVKQGLRHSLQICIDISAPTRRAYSSKTRIKTLYSIGYWASKALSQSIFQ